MQYIKPIPIGVEFYKQMISEEYYYIDAKDKKRKYINKENVIFDF